MKKLSVFLCMSLTLVICFFMPVSAGVMVPEGTDGSSLAPGTVIYSEDFNSAKGSSTQETVDSLGWTISEGLREFTAVLSVKDGKLHADNLDATVGTSNDSYAVIMDSDFLRKICTYDYTYQYDATYLEAENTYRYVSLLCNYDGVDNYNTVDVRIRGDGYNQVRRGESNWIHYNNTTCPLRAADDTSMLHALYGETFDENVPAMQNRTFTVRVEMSMEKGPAVYVNGMLVSEMEENTENWGDIDAYAICYKTSTKLLSEIDNIIIWAGTGVEPVFPEPETEAAAELPAETAAAENPAAVTSAAPATADTMAWGLLGAAVCAVFVAAGRRLKR